MRKSDTLTTTTFQCSNCGDTRKVEAMGVIVSGPNCPQCNRPMGEVKIIQTELDLFS